MHVHPTGKTHAKIKNKAVYLIILPQKRIYFVGH